MAIDYSKYKKASSTPQSGGIDYSRYKKTAPKKATFGSRMEEKTNERAKTIVDSVDAFRNKEQGAARSIFQIGGQLVGGAIDPFVSGVETAASKLPEPIKKPIRATLGAIGAGYSKAIQPAAEALSRAPGFEEFAQSPGGAALERDVKASNEYLNAFIPAAKPGKLGKIGGDIVRKSSEVVDDAGKVIATRAETKQISRIKDEVDELFNQSRGIQSKVKLSEQKNVPLRDIVSDPSVFRGLKVEGGAINPDQAIDILDTRIDTLMGAKARMLPEFDRLLPKVTREAVRADAVSKIRGTMSPADEKDLIASINKQVDALPEEMTISELDSFRARFRKSARDARGLQRSNSEYTALEDATRDQIFKQTDNLPFDTNGEFGALNTNIKNMLEAKAFLDKTIRGQKVKGGRLGNYTGRIIGGIAGLGGGPITAILGSEVGGAVAKILTDNQLGSSFKMRLIRGITDDANVIKEAQRFLNQVQDYKPPALPAAMPGGPRSVIRGNSPIALPKDTASTLERMEIGRIQSQPNVIDSKTSTPRLMLPARGESPIQLPSRIGPTKKSQEQVDAEYGRNLKR